MTSIDSVFVSVTKDFRDKTAHCYHSIQLMLKLKLTCHTIYDTFDRVTEEKAVCA